MNTTAEPEAVVTVPQQTRIGQLVRWSVRITSIPVFALVVTCLVPALATFSISAKDDKIIALGLCAVCAGLVAGWRWASLGGGLIVVGVVLMLAQGDSLLSPDPFSVAFGLQGILFLIAGMLNVPGGQAAMPALRWIRRTGIALLALCAAAGAATIYHGPGPMPVPKDKETFVGVWQAGTGLTMEITAEGRAKVRQDKDSKVEAWNNPLARGTTGAFLAYFRADDKLELTTGPFGGSKVYHIDRLPHADGKQIKMVLNGSDPYKRGSGMVLVKKPAS